MAPGEELEKLKAENAKCGICRENLFDETGNPTKHILSVAGLGPSHDACFWPYMREEEIRILFQVRCYSIGDTIASTPALREVRRRYPRAHITVMTIFPDLFEFSPYVNEILDMNKTIYEKQVNSHHFKIDAFKGDGGHFSTHSVEYSTQSALGASIYPTEWNYDVFYNEEVYKSAKRIALEKGIDPDKDQCILVHPHGTEWATRDWGPSHMPSLVSKLRLKYPDHKIVSIGGNRAAATKNVMKNYVELSGVIDLYGSMSLLETCAFMDFSCNKLLVTPDTGTLHVAGSRPELPIVGVFTLIKSHFRTPVRHGKYGYKFLAVESDSGCNCTYNTRLFTNEGRFDSCPKKTFLERTKRLNLPKPTKLEGLKGFLPEYDWSKEDLSKQINERINDFKPGELPCFPLVDKVFAACVAAMEKWSNGISPLPEG